MNLFRAARCDRVYLLGLPTHATNAMTYNGNVIDYISNVTAHIGIFVTDIAILTPNITNVSRYIGIATGQHRIARVK